MSVRRSVGRSVGPSVGNAFVSAGRDEPANDLFRVYDLVFLNRNNGSSSGEMNRERQELWSSTPLFVCCFVFKKIRIRCKREREKEAEERKKSKTTSYIKTTEIHQER